MTPTNEEIGKRMVVWMVAIASGVEAATAGLVAHLDGRFRAAVIWWCAGGLLVVIGANLESVNLFLGRLED